MKNLVVYHANCADGFTAAWAAYRMLGAGEDVEYRAYYHDWDPPEDAAEFNNIYVVDFSFPAKVLVELAKQVKEQVVLLDHHKSAQADLSELVQGDCPPNLLIQFNMEKSGAMLAWEHFHPGTCPPTLVEYVQDRDLWSWALPGSMEVSTYIQTLEFDFARWDTVATQLEEDHNWVVAQGVAMQEYRDALIKRVCQDPGMTRIEGYVVPCVNAPQWQSEIGNVLCKEHPFAVMWFMNKSGRFIYSLRSDKDRPDEAVDVSVIAKQFGGGGHKNAAGFRSKAPPWMLKFDEDGKVLP